MYTNALIYRDAAVRVTVDYQDGIVEDCAGDDLTGAPGETVTLQGTCSTNPRGNGMS